MGRVDRALLMSTIALYIVPGTLIECFYGIFLSRHLVWLVSSQGAEWKGCSKYAIYVEGRICSMPSIPSPTWTVVAPRLSIVVLSSVACPPDRVPRNQLETSPAVPNLPDDSVGNIGSIGDETSM